MPEASWQSLSMCIIANLIIVAHWSVVLDSPTGCCRFDFCIGTGTLSDVCANLCYYWLSAALPTSSAHVCEWCAIRRWRLSCVYFIYRFLQRFSERCLAWTLFIPSRLLPNILIYVTRRYCFVYDYRFILRLSTAEGSPFPALSVADGMYRPWAIRLS